MVIAGAGQHLRIVGTGPGGVGVPARLAAEIEQPDPAGGPVDQGGRVRGRPELAGVLDHRHRRPGLAAVGAAAVHQVDVLPAESRVVEVVLPRLGERQHRAVRRRLDGGDPIGEVPSRPLDEHIRARRRSGRPESQARRQAPSPSPAVRSIITPHSRSSSTVQPGSRIGDSATCGAFSQRSGCGTSSQRTFAWSVHIPNHQPPHLTHPDRSCPALSQDGHAIDRLVLRGGEEEGTLEEMAELLLENLITVVISPFLEDRSRPAVMPAQRTITKTSNQDRSEKRSQVHGSSHRSMARPARMHHCRVSGRKLFPGHSSLRAGFLQGSPSLMSSGACR